MTFGHDALGRPTSKDLPGAEPDAAYSYDLLGRMLSATQNGISVGFTWDALGRQRTQTIPIASVANPVFTSDYDLAGRRTRLTWPVDASGPTAYHVDYDYLVTGEMEKAREKGATSGAGVLATFGYDDLGRRSSIVRGNGASTSYQYDAVSRLWRIGHDFAGTSHDLTIEFAYNPASQIVGRSATNSAYAWDGHGSGSTASTADGLNRLSSHGGATPTYDAKGNITFDGTYSYAYSSENLLTSFSTSGTLEYDPLMRFYRNYTTHFIHDGPTGELIGDYYNGNIVGRYVPGPGPDEPLALVDKFGNRTWFHADERGSVIASSGAAGANSRIVKFDEYGKRGSGGSWRFAFTGQIHLLGDVYDYKNRHYNARLGRFLQADPIGYAGGMNLYAYVGGDPVNFVDPLGLAENEIVITGRPLRPQNPPPPPTRAGTWGQISPGAGGHAERGEDRNREQKGCDSPEDDPTNCAEVNGPPPKLSVNPVIFIPYAVAPEVLTHRRPSFCASLTYRIGQITQNFGGGIQDLGFGLVVAGGAIGLSTYFTGYGAGAGGAVASWGGTIYAFGTATSTLGSGAKFLAGDTNAGVAAIISFPTVGVSSPAGQIASEKTLSLLAGQALEDPCR